MEDKVLWIIAKKTVRRKANETTQAVRGKAEGVQVGEVIFASGVEEKFLMGVKRPVHSPPEKGTSERQPKRQ